MRLQGWALGISRVNFGTRLKVLGLNLEAPTHFFWPLRDFSQNTLQLRHLGSRGNDGSLCLVPFLHHGSGFVAVRGPMFIVLFVPNSTRHKGC